LALANEEVMDVARIPVVLMLCVIAAAGGTAGAQTYPAKVVRIVTTQPGGPNDVTARVIAQGLGSLLGQQVIVDNRAGGIIATDTVAKAPADGYTLLLNGSIVWLLPLMRSNTPWDMFRDFAPVTLAVRAPSVLVVHPSLPAKSAGELIALAKSRPGQLDYASAVAGSANHLTAELFKAMAGINIVHVPYKGGGQALTALLSGEAHLMFGLGEAVSPHLKSGRLRALAVTSAEPSPLFPGIPPVSQAVRGYEAVSMFGLLAPATTPAAIIARLNQETARVLNAKETGERFTHAGMEVVGGPPAQFSAAIKSEVARMGKVIRDAGIRAE
jgi:tripartite-type tricarboxylate transporter receptor subunit TctC